jgi:E3 ubiquitin-protein ligase HUWE1
MSPLQEKANASLVGGDVDELVRHHPWLKASIFKGIIDVLEKIESLANDTKPKEGLEGYFNLIPVNDKADGVASGNATPMETDSPNAGTPSGTAEKPTVAAQPSFELGEMPVYQFLNSFSKVITVCIFLYGAESIL